MIDIQHQHLQIIHHILDEFLPNTAVWAFGSRIQGRAKTYSDLDLVIVGQQQIPLKIYYQIQDAFEESALPYRVDILDWHRISADFKAVILKQYVDFKRA